MKALSIRQPWAWLIMSGHKPIENRDWQTLYRGQLLIHAARTMTRDDYEACRIFVAGFSNICLPPPNTLSRGGFVGRVTLTDILSEHLGGTHEESPVASVWFQGEYGWVMENPVLFPFVPARGQLKLWDVVVDTMGRPTP